MLCCAAASGVRNFHGESDWSQAQGCTESANHCTRTLGPPELQEGTCSELKETLAYVVEELGRGNLLQYL